MVAVETRRRGQFWIQFKHQTNRTCQWVGYKGSTQQTKTANRERWFSKHKQRRFYQKENDAQKAQQQLSTTVTKKVYRASERKREATDHHCSTRLGIRHWWETLDADSQSSALRSFTFLIPKIWLITLSGTGLTLQVLATQSFLLEKEELKG